MADMGWSQYIRSLDDAAELEEQARTQDMLPHLAALCEYDSPHEMYRVFYKYTDCGPWVSVHVNGSWVHCGELHLLGTWEEMLRRGDIVDEVLIGSIVEGSDAEATPVSVRIGDIRSKRSRHGVITQASLRAALAKAVDDVNQEACALWHESNAEGDE